jgi:hypothetical protein
MENTIIYLENKKSGPKRRIVNPRRIDAVLPGALVAKIEKYSETHGISMTTAWGLAADALIEKDQKCKGN